MTRATSLSNVLFPAPLDQSNQILHPDLHDKVDFREGVKIAMLDFPLQQSDEIFFKSTNLFLRNAIFH